VDEGGGRNADGKERRDAEAGYTAFFVELTYDSGFSVPFKFTTEVSVTPDVLPFKWEDAAAKYPDTAPK